MVFNKIHRLFPFGKLFKLVLGMAVVLQVVIISYNHFTGYHPLNGFDEFTARVVRGIIYSMIAGFAIAYPDLLIIRYMNQKHPWGKGAFKTGIFSDFAHANYSSNGFDSTYLICSLG
jgi:two-component system, LytTR family, sensor kinase